MAWGKKPNNFRTGYKYRKMRKKLLKLNPLCHVCKAKGITKASEILDHRIPTAFGGHETDIRNLQLLCFECHEDKSKVEWVESRYYKRYKEKDSWPPCKHGFPRHRKPCKKCLANHEWYLPGMEGFVFGNRTPKEAIVNVKQRED